MKRFSVIIVALLVLALSTGVAMAKSGGSADKGADKGNSGKNKASTHQLKQKLDLVNSNINKGVEIEDKFSDAKGHWANSAILKMSAIGIIKGDAEGTFRPDDPITQVETVALATRIAKEGTPGDVPDWARVSVQNAVYNGDVPDWAKDSVQSAVYKGIININRFHSRVQADRAMAAVIIAKSLNLQPVDTSDLPFNDGILISREDAGYIMALYQEGIIKGSPEGKFNPNSAITRAEMATIMERIVAGQAEASETTQTNSTTESGGTQN